MALERKEKIRGEEKRKERIVEKKRREEWGAQTDTGDVEVAPLAARGVEPFANGCGRLAARRIAQRAPDACLAIHPTLVHCRQNRVRHSFVRWSRAVIFDHCAFILSSFMHSSVRNQKNCYLIRKTKLLKIYYMTQIF